jgi:hypothetical protein
MIPQVAPEVNYRSGFVICSSVVHRTRVPLGTESEPARSEVTNHFWFRRASLEVLDREPLSCLCAPLLLFRESKELFSPLSGVCLKITNTTLIVPDIRLSVLTVPGHTWFRV